MGMICNQLPASQGVINTTTVVQQILGRTPNRQERPTNQSGNLQKQRADRNATLTSNGVGEVNAPAHDGCVGVLGSGTND